MQAGIQRVKLGPITRLECISETYQCSLKIFSTPSSTPPLAKRACPSGRHISHNQGHYRQRVRRDEKEQRSEDRAGPCRSRFFSSRGERQSASDLARETGNHQCTLAGAKLHPFALLTPLISINNYLQKQASERGKLPSNRVFGAVSANRQHFPSA